MRRHRLIKIACILLLLYVGYRALSSTDVFGSRGAGATKHIADLSENADEGIARDAGTGDSAAGDAFTDTTGGSAVGIADEGRDKGEETIVGWIIDKIASGEVELSDENSVRNAISQGENELEISLTEENKDRIVEFAGTLDSVETGAEDFIERAGEMYRKYGTEFVEDTNEAINEAVESAAQSAAESFFESVKQTAADFFRNLISGGS